ncbi:MAG: hypothetical protein ACR2OU_21610 [Thermomicrobiales bacterium]
MSDGWQAVVNGAIIAMIAALALLIVDGANGRNLAISVVLGALAMIVTYVRAQRS